jgi:AAA family ATP:ADP antiporter
MAGDHALARAFGRVVSVKPHEVGGLLASFLTVFCMFTGYSVLRPVRETMGITQGVANLPYLFWATFAGMLLVQPLYGWLTSRYRRTTFLPWVYLFFALNLVGFWVWFGVQADHTWIARTYYVWLSVFNLFVVAVFWSLMADVFTREQAGRMFAFIAAGISTGGLVGPLLTTQLAERIGTINLLLVAVAMLGLSIVFMLRVIAWQRQWGETGGAAAAAAAADSAVASMTATGAQAAGPGASGSPTATAAARREDIDRPLGGSAWAGFRQVVSSPYLVLIALFVFLLTWISTFLYLEQAALVEKTFASRDARTEFFGRIDFWVQALSLALQTLLFSRLFKRFGFGVLLLSMPVLMTLGYAAFALAPTFAVFVVVMMIRRIGEYGITRPCRDMLWTIVPRAEKYKAKSLVDTFVYRGGDAISASVHKLLTTFGGLGTSGVAWFGAATAIVWAAVAFALARRNAREANRSGDAATAGA